MVEPLLRRALCVMIGSFTGANEEPATLALSPISGVAELRLQLRERLAALGYECVPVMEEPSAVELGRAVEDFLAAPMPAGGLRIVHVLSHGVPRPNSRDAGLEIVGADGATDANTDVERWLRRADRDPDGPATLFLLDVCRAGEAAQLPYQLTTDRRRTLVLAASTGAEAAYDARFTREVVVALGKAADGGYNVSRGHDCIVPRLVAQDVQARVAAARPGQQVTSNLWEWLQDEPAFAFFPNLRPAEADDLPAGIDPGVGELARGMDPAHFIDRAYAPGPFPRMGSGLFFGRDYLVGHLAGFLDGFPHPTAPPDGIERDRGLAEVSETGLRVVTGSPGSGKSALLGVLVCAAHPLLREPTDPAWNRLDTAPSENSDLVAVHARQLTTQQIIDSLARQLRLPYPSSRPATAGGAGAGQRWEQETLPVGPGGTRAGDGGRLGGGWSAHAVLEAIAARDRPPVIVVDAVDEAAQPTELIHQLLLPLAAHTTGKHPDAGAVTGDRDGQGCRLLVGTRAWPQFQPILEAARQQRGLINLDTEPAADVRRAISQYVTALLNRQRPYNTPEHSQARVRFADTVAGRLTSSDAYSTGGTRHDDASHQGPDDSGASMREIGSLPVAHGMEARLGFRPSAAGSEEDLRWGEFLVAALYTHHTITRHLLPADPDEAAATGTQVPGTLPDVMEMDLQARRTDPWARPILATLAFARGDGLPMDVLAHLAPVFHPDGPDRTPDPTLTQVQTILKTIRFYLRLTPDPDGVIHYRLFHQGLTDYLKNHPTHP